MEKQQNCDSMTTVTVKDFNPQMDYQEPPPAYRPMKTTPMVQVAKIVAVAAVAIAAMLSFAMVFSAWLTQSSCQQQLQQLQQQHHQLTSQQQHPPPSFEALIQPESLKNILLGSTGPSSASLLGNKDTSQETRGGNDLDSSESKTNDQNNSKNDSSSEEDDDNNSGEEAVTMLKLPVELSIHEHMFDRNHRSQMNCIIEKKKAEEIVDEQAKSLPPLLGLNMTTDPRYLHFTGEKMAISCDSGNDHRHPPPHAVPQGPFQGGVQLLETMIAAAQQQAGPRHHPHHYHQGHPMPMPFSSSSLRESPAQTLASAIAAASSSSVPIQIIGPIPLSASSQSDSPFAPHSSSSAGPFGGFGSQMIPILVSSQGNGLDDLPTSNSGNGDNIFFGPVAAPQQSSPHHHTIHYQPISQQQQSAPMHQSSFEAQYPYLSESPSHPFQFSPAGGLQQPQSGELRERAVPHPIPIMPRAHVQHVIRPRRSVDNVVQKRVKRCSCDCACKNHQE